MTVVVSGLYIYPVKSAAGIACDSVTLGTSGFAHDREWMVVDANGRGITQRDESRLALLGTAIQGETLLLGNPHGAGPTLELAHGGNRVEVQVWGARCAAFDAGDEAARFLSDWLGKTLRLVRFDTSRQRLSNHDWTGGRDVPTLFTDGYPLLVLSRASIGDLAARVGRNLPVQRFRPNVLLDGVEPYAEDAASELVVGDVVLQLTKACTRCVITTIDQTRGELTDDEPLRTLKGYRFDAALRGVAFGRNAYATAGVGTTLQRGAAALLRG
jgi:uncharacterized protein YcbX